MPLPLLGFLGAAYGMHKLDQHEQNKRKERIKRAVIAFDKQTRGKDLTEDDLESFAAVIQNPQEAKIFQAFMKQAMETKPTWEDEPVEAGGPLAELLGSGATKGQAVKMLGPEGIRMAKGIKAPMSYSEQRLRDEAAKKAGKESLLENLMGGVEAGAYSGEEPRRGLRTLLAAREATGRPISASDTWAGGELFTPQESRIMPAMTTAQLSSMRVGPEGIKKYREATKPEVTETPKARLLRWWDKEGNLHPELVRADSYDTRVAEIEQEGGRFEKPEKPEKPEMTHAQALERISQIDSKIVQIRATGGLNPLLMAMLKQTNPEAATALSAGDTDQAIESLENEKKYIEESFLPEGKRTKTEPPLSQITHTFVPGKGLVSAGQ